MLVIIDNYDSFTYNIVQTIAGNARREGREEDIRVFRNDRITLAEIEAMQPDRLLISPGPCSPKEAGISIEAIRYFSDKLPILGVCLGHQSIGEAFGGRTVRARRIMHGKTSPMHHDGRGVFTGLPNPFDGMRYHSLVVEEETLPDCLEHHRPHRRGGTDGPPAQNPADRRGAVSSRIDHDPGRHHAPAEFHASGLSRMVRA